MRESSGERIYSARQLVDALRSALAAVKDQLGVLAILDGTATSWPGVNQSVEDLEHIVEASAKTTSTMDMERTSFNAQLTETLQQINALKGALAGANDARDHALFEAAAAGKACRLSRASETSLQSELQGTKQDLWATEKERADLATQVEKQKQDAEELNTQMVLLKSSHNDQGHQLAYLKEDLAGRKADVTQLSKLSKEQGTHNAHLKATLDTTAAQLKDTTAVLLKTRSERAHYEKEAHRLSEEASNLGVALDLAQKEIAKMKDWNDVMKKVEVDRFAELEHRAGLARVEAVRFKAEVDAKLQMLHSEAAHREERLKGREVEVGNFNKQVALLALNIKELSKQLAASNAERIVVGRQRDESRVTAAKHQGMVNVLNLRLQEREKAAIVSDGSAREHLLAERIALTARLDESLKECAVHKALAEGWHRDIRQSRAASQDSKQQCETMQAAMERMSRDVEAAKFEAIKANVALEQQLRTSQAHVLAKESEVKKLQFEGQSQIKSLQSMVERLQRENDAAGEEVQRLRHGDVAFVRLPAVGKRPISMHDDLAKLRKAIVTNAMSYHAGAASPPAILVGMNMVSPGISPELGLPSVRNQTR